MTRNRPIFGPTLAFSMLCVPLAIGLQSISTPRQVALSRALDADGRPASLSAADWSRIQQAYQPSPLTGGSLVQQAYLKASNTDANDTFGAVVVVSGDTVVVGAQSEESNATGVNGDQSNNSYPFAGAAYVFARNGSSWTQQAYLKASNTDPGDLFGGSVAISDDTLVVGAWNESSSATGVNGDQGNNDASRSGAAYVFVRNGTTWSLQAYLKASNTDSDDLFGASVAISGDTIVVAADNEGSSVTGVNGDQNDNTATHAGAVYVFVRNGTSWSQQAYLKASNTDARDNFGDSVAVSGDTVVVGAFGEDSKATGVNGDQSNNSANAAGAAYVFVRNGTSWSQQAYLKASNTEVLDLFGESVAVADDTVVVGALLEDSAATGVDGDQSDNSANGSGAAYVFVRNGTLWSQQAYLKASNTEAGDAFGAALAALPNTVVSGSPGESSNATGVNGNQANNSAPSSGAVYVFVRSGTSWRQDLYVKASNTNTGDGFGTVGVTNDTLVVGASFESSSATGVNSDQSNNAAFSAGAAYTYLYTPGPLASCSFRNGSGINPPDFSCVTAPVIGTNWISTIALTPTQGSVTTTTIVIRGIGGPISGIFVLGNQELLVFPVALDASVGPSLGMHSIPLPPDPTLVGMPIFTQGLRIELSPLSLVLLNAQDLVVGF